MRKTVAFVIVFLLLVGIILGGCSNEQKSGNSSDKNKFKIGYDIYYAGNSWSVQMYNEFKSEVKKHSDLISGVVYTESEGKVDKQIANIESLISKNVDVIITTPNSPTALVPVLKKAQSRGIKVVLLGATIKADAYDVLVTVDDVDFGRVGAEWLVEQLKGKGNVVALNGIAGLSVSSDRWRGAKEVFEKNPGIKVISEVNADWDYATAKTKMSSILAAHPKIDAVWSQGGTMTLGTIDAFHAANRQLVPMTSEDNNGFLKQWNQITSENPNFRSIAVSKPTWLGSESLITALDLLQGKKVKKDQVIDPPTITNDNLGKFVREDLPDSFWANTRMTDDEIKKIFDN